MGGGRALLRPGDLIAVGARANGATTRLARRPFEDEDDEDEDDDDDEDDEDDDDEDEVDCDDEGGDDDDGDDDVAGGGYDVDVG